MGVEGGIQIAVGTSTEILWWACGHSTGGRMDGGVCQASELGSAGEPTP